MSLSTTQSWSSWSVIGSTWIHKRLSSGSALNLAISSVSGDGMWCSRNDVYNRGKINVWLTSPLCFTTFNLRLQHWIKNRNIDRIQERSAQSTQWVRSVRMDTSGAKTTVGTHRRGKYCWRFRQSTWSTMVHVVHSSGRSSRCLSYAGLCTLE